MSPHHGWEHNVELWYCLEDAQEAEEAQLQGSVEIHPPVANVPEVLVVRPVLVGCDEQEETLDELGRRKQLRSRAVWWDVVTCTPNKAENPMKKKTP